MMNRKNPKLDMRKYRGLFFNLGLVISLGLILTAFEWKSPVLITSGDLLDLPDDPMVLDIPVTRQVPPPPPPKFISPVIKEVPNDRELKELTEVVDLTPDDVPQNPVELLPPPAEEEPKEIFFIVEEQPKFMGREREEFLKYVSSQLVYPLQARRNRTEGKVFVQFIVDDTGKMRDIEVVRGIGSGCDEEVLRVLKEAPAWEPGKQRGKPVNVKMIVPVTFRLE